VFHSKWVVYCSFPMRRATDDKGVLDRGLSHSVLPWQHHEASRYNEDGSVDVDSDGDESDESAPSFPDLAAYA